MPIKFSEHALLRLKGRKISKLRVENSIKFPDKIIKGDRGRKLRQKKFGDKILEVVTKTEGSKITVITEYYLEGKNEN